MYYTKELVEFLKCTDKWGLCWSSTISKNPHAYCFGNEQLGYNVTGKNIRTPSSSNKYCLLLVRDIQ